ncbi:hypothetical protein Fleli_1754 [Bernardetia litoralis DSM 6794]|uniref:Transposase n=2 Tax=Bernardetia litoralis TaxID=999 RepID=I4AJL8_BERLS|nr:helix-turn-helix domain-containing protein [Bernardetia litoralis]AFM04123.1 hypothetical protein Fleli_1717 [Bernardetia litoralis DSM 6794]AFM04153.1 hypothetical protein Fleli_1754 [Bernardetia litoralis DSM 6794]
MKKQHISLSIEDKHFLEELLSKGSLSVRTHRRALCIKKLDLGLSYQAVSELLEVNYVTVFNWSKKYKSEGLSFLYDKPRSGRPIKYDGQTASKVTALACSTPPEGYQRWSLRLLSDRIVELSILPEMSYSQVGRVLKKMNFNLIGNDNGALEK